MTWEIKIEFRTHVMMHASPSTQFYIYYIRSNQPAGAVTSIGKQRAWKRLESPLIITHSPVVSFSRKKLEMNKIMLDHTRVSYIRICQSVRVHSACVTVYGDEVCLSFRTTPSRTYGCWKPRHCVIKDGTMGGGSRGEKGEDGARGREASYSQIRAERNIK